jgi:serine/threonine protein kinase/lipoprotein NlpI
MKSERRKQIEELYHAASLLDVSQREAFLDQACAEDADLRREIATLLSSEAAPATEVMAQVIHVETDPSPIGRKIGHYQIRSLLGAGGMGNVFLAQDTHLRRSVAIKLLPVKFTADAGRVRRFAREARAASALNHPNIITIHEIDEAETHHYIVTEYVAGETLRERLMDAPQGRLIPSEALDVAMQIASALAAAHKEGITHRDIKPENVMVRPDGWVKVLDFGLAKLTEAPSLLVDDFNPSTLVMHSTETGMVMGTARYMSPEQARGEKIDGRTDIFSLGVVIYEMIAGRAPFVGATTNETIAAILRDEPLPLSRHTPEAGIELERIVSHALRKKRDDRYQSAEHLLADLKTLKQQLELQTKLREIGSVSQSTPRASSKTVAKDSPGALGRLAPALRAIAGWVSRRAEPILTERDLILLADFENKTGEDVFDGTLKQSLSIQLQQSPFLSLFPEERARQTLQLMKRSPEERITARIAREICVRHNVKALITGSIASLGSHYVITLEAIRSQTGETLENEQVEARSKEQVLKALSRAATRLRAKLGESLGSIQQFDKDQEDTTTQKLEAFQAYSLGYEQSLKGRVMDAIQLYRRATELDPDFAYAWSMLSIHHSFAGRSGLAGECAEKAYALKDQVSDYEQLQITFRYHFIFTGDMNKALEAATLFKRTYPRTSTAPIDLLVAYDLIGQHDQAVAEGREAISLNPNFAPAYWYLGRALLRTNRFAEARDIFNQALGQKFDSTNIHAALYQIAFTGDDTTGMQRQLDWLNGKREQYVGLDCQAGAMAFAGRWRKSQEFSRSAIDLAGRRDTSELAARYATEQALRGVVLEDLENAKADAAQALTMARTRASLPRAALALAFCGDTNNVAPLIDELIARYPSDTVIKSIWLPTIRAALELQRKKADQAIEELRTTSSYEAAAEFWPQYLRGLAFLKLERGEDAATEFQKILSHRGQAPLSPLYPLAYLGSARASALVGHIARSRKARRDFLAAWKDADPDLPMLIAAKQEWS